MNEKVVIATCESVVGDHMFSSSELNSCRWSTEGGIAVRPSSSVPLKAPGLQPWLLVQGLLVVVFV